MFNFLKKYSFIVESFVSRLLQSLEQIIFCAFNITSTEILTQPLFPQTKQWVSKLEKYRTQDT
jgi:hypothetical protein